MKRIIGYSILAVIFIAMGIACAITTGDWWAPFAIYGGVAVMYVIINVAVGLIYDKSGPR